MSYADVLFNLLSTGHPYTAIVTSYTNVLGGFFYLMIFGLALVMIYIKNQNFGTVAIVGILMSVGVTAMVPDIAWATLTLIIVLGVAVILYRVFR